MKYQNLTQLINKSHSCRKFFMSLPVELQMELHKYGEYIETAESLRRTAAEMRNIMRLKEL